MWLQVPADVTDNTKTEDIATYRLNPPRGQFIQNRYGDFGLGIYNGGSSSWLIKQYLVGESSMSKINKLTNFPPQWPVEERIEIYQKSKR